MKLKSLTLACVAAGTLAGPLAANAFTAQEVFLNVLTNVDGIFGGDADTFTNVFTELAVNPNAQSNYVEGVVPGPLNVADGILTHGEILAFSDVGTALVSNMVPVLPGENELFPLGWGLRIEYNVGGFAQVNLDADGPGGNAPLAALNVNNPAALISGGSGKTWAAQYGLSEGAPIGLLPQFTSGVIKVFLNDPSNRISDALGGTNGQQLLQLNLQTPVDGVQFGNLTLNGVLDYSWYTPGTNQLVEEMFNFVSSGKTFYEAADNTVVDWRFDTNVDPNLVPFNDGGTGNIKPGLPGGAGPFTGTCQQGTLCRVTNLNSTVAFQVPEPMGVALMGAGLLSLGVASRRKAKRSAA